MNFAQWVAGVGAAIKGNANQTASLQDSVNGLSKNLQELATYTKALAEKTIAVSDGAPAEKISALETSLSAIGKRIDDMQIKNSALEERIASVTGRVDSIAKSITDLTDISAQLAALPEL